MVNDYIRGSNRNVKKVKKLNFNKFDLLSNFTKKFKFSFSGACKANEYMCVSGKNCIPLDYICDGVTDCEDNDDELQCSRKLSRISTCDMSFLWGRGTLD